MTTARKRPRSDEGSEAECPFIVTHPNPNQKNKNAKRRRQSLVVESQPPPKIPLQASPFSPMGRFKDPNNNLDRYFQVNPHQRWMDMTRYNSFVLNGIKYYSEGFVFVANNSTNSTAERQKDSREETQCILRPDDDWVARILEIRASDEHHVYARVYWMYWPDELPSGIRDGRKVIQGRQWYHGRNELIASNHMDIINVVSVAAQATVNQWDETNEDEVHQALYWRQALDVSKMELSPAIPRCTCNRPENPDKKMMNCTNSECTKWLHHECLIHEALMGTFARLGTDKPHTLARTRNRELKNGKRPLSPSEPGETRTTRQSINVKPESQQSVKLASMKAAGTPLKAENGKGRRKSDKVQMDKSQPYDGLFSAVIRGTLSPVVEIEDLRKNVVGGVKSWTEPLHCLVCSAQIH